MADFFSTLFGGGAETDAANANKALAAQYGTSAQDYLKTGYDTGTTDLNKAVGAYDPLSALGTKYGSAGDMLMNSLGLNGPQGNAIAAGTFQNDPGTQGAINAGLDIINRRRATQGMDASGNADIDAQTFGQNLQNQQYQNWQNQLTGLNTLGANLTGTAAAGQAGGYTNLANLAGQYAQSQTGVAGTTLNADTSANTLQAQGEAAGAKNLLGAGLSLATLGMGGNPFGGSLTGGSGSSTGGGSSLLSSLGNSFKNLNLAQGVFGGGSPTGYG
jgi:hypothetical protein